MGDTVNACWGLLSNTEMGVVEVASTCGLDMPTKKDRNPMLASSYGLGELILAALDQGVRHFIVGLGGSACNDGGAGMLQALGLRLNNAGVGCSSPPITTINFNDLQGL